MLALLMLAAILVLGIILILRLIPKMQYRVLSIITLVLTVAFLAIFTNAGRSMAKTLGIPMGADQQYAGQNFAAARGQNKTKRSGRTSSQAPAKGNTTAVFPDGSQTVLRGTV
ncbi:MAG TPA: hypothetical protein VHR42_08515 [Clostridia bacterium]|nr:hypothetical protein [Clostridia bacterium]